MSTSKKRRKAAPPGSRKPASPGPALAALDQVCWHLVCCDFLFDVIEAESKIAFHQLAADVENARLDAEGLLREALRRKGWASHATGSTAAGFLQRFEDQFEGDPPIIEDIGAGWPQCAKTTGGAPCTELALYVGNGEWSGCENHMTEDDRDKHRQWQLGQDLAHRRGDQQLDLRLRIAHALMDWWSGQSGAQDAFQNGVLD